MFQQVSKHDAPSSPRIQLKGNCIETVAGTVDRLLSIVELASFCCVDGLVDGSVVVLAVVIVVAEVSELFGDEVVIRFVLFLCSVVVLQSNNKGLR